MKEFPHRYAVTAVGKPRGEVRLEADGLPRLLSAAPVQFGGPGDRWSPENLLVAAVADCFLLTFRPVAAASNLAWTSVSCSVTGVLDRVDRVVQFTRFELGVELDVQPGTDLDFARRVLDKAERSCLVTSSLKAPVDIVSRITFASEPVAS